MSDYKKHPMVHVCPLAELDDRIKAQGFVVVLQGRDSRICTGCTPCDFRDASVLFFRPGSLNDCESRIHGESLSLSFCGDWLDGSLAKAFGPYSPTLCCSSKASWEQLYPFFSYSLKESLHLSLKEKAMLEHCLDDIKREKDWGIDSHTNVLLAEKIKVFFDYCARYYERQFITRSCLHRSLLIRLQHVADEYLLTGEYNLCHPHVPTSRFAGQMEMSEAYLLDFLKHETGKTLAQYLCFRHFEVAKHQLLHSPCSILETARRLGYTTAQCFATAFKRVVGCTPAEYRNAN